MDIGPEPTEHHHHTGHRWVDFSLAGAALLISLVSIIVAILHGRTMEAMADANGRLVQANSWPFLTAILSVDPKAAEFGVRNTGVGPAKVHWVEVALDGKPVRSSRDLLKTAIATANGQGQPAAHVGFSYSAVDNGVIRAGDGVVIASLSAAHTPPGVFKAWHDQVLRLHLTTCYCSVFDECFIGDGQSLDPKPVKTCPAPDAPYDPNP